MSRFTHYILFFVLVLFEFDIYSQCLNGSSQCASGVFVYQEDFTNDNNLGWVNNIYSPPADGNWSLNLVGSPDVSGNNDHCKVTGGSLEWRDNMTYHSDHVDWYSKVINGNMTDLCANINWAIAGGSSGINSILRFYYQIDGGSWVKFEDKHVVVDLNDLNL